MVKDLSDKNPEDVICVHNVMEKNRAPLNSKGDGFTSARMKVRTRRDSDIHYESRSPLKPTKRPRKQRHSQMGSFQRGS